MRASEVVRGRGRGAGPTTNGGLWRDGARRRFPLLGLCVLVLPLIMTVAGISPARAADGVSFVHRDYDLQIQRNGDVTVAERWQVRFSGGPYVSATLGVFLTHAQTVDFDHVTGADAKSEHVATVEDSQGHAIEQISWTFPAARDETRVFTIPYTLHGAIAQNQTQAWLDRHFFDGPGRGSFPVAAARVTVTLPTAGGDVQVKSDYAGAPLQVSHPSNTTVALDAQNLNSGQLLEVEVAFARTQLDASVLRPTWQHGDTPPSLPTKLDSAAAPAPAPSIGPTNPVEGFFANVGLVLAVGLVIVAILGFLAWRIAKRLAADIRELGGEQAASGSADDEVDEAGLPLITKPLPAIDLNFGEVEWPTKHEEPDFEALGLHPLEEGASGPISRVGVHEDEHDDGHDADPPEAERGTGAISGVGEGSQ